MPGKYIERNSCGCMEKRLLILLSCLFVVMVGYGLTLPVLPFYIERLALSEGASSAEASFHVGILTGIFALMGVGLAMLMTTRIISFIVLYVALFAFGAALIVPSLAASVSK